ncbi:MAG: 6-carboxytetrahydropterin synthase QueD [Spirochaetes bacterium]|nr:6-carboxytetrahydropterin synthase QueD [Spirochaetota bacterium]
MYCLRVFDYFSSAHFLNGYQGKCEDLHGHNWKVEAEIEGEKLDNVGMLIDFKIFKASLKEILNELDHCLLNNLEVFKNSNPSAEFIAKYIYTQLQNKMPSGINVSRISVWESERSQAVYYE